MSITTLAASANNQECSDESLGHFLLNFNFLEDSCLSIPPIQNYCPAMSGVFYCSLECFKQLPHTNDTRYSHDAGSALNAIGSTFYTKPFVHVDRIILHC